LSLLFVQLVLIFRKTGWANQQSSAVGVVEVKTDQFPEDANEKILRVNAMMNQLTGTSLTTMIGQVDPLAQQALLAAGPAGALGIMPSAQLTSVADAALDMAFGVAPIAIGSSTPASASTNEAPMVNAKIVGRFNNRTQNILVHNMFDKDEETERGWEEDIRLDFEEECAQYGKIAHVVVMSDDPGGMIYASFDSVESATKCATSLAGRWFDKRQLRVEFVDSIPNSS
jgi:RNA-binding protein 39